MSTPDSTTVWIQQRLDLIAAGQDHTHVRDELLRRASRRIHHLVTASMRARPRLARWEQDEDLLQDVLLRIDRAVRDAKPANPGQFFVIVAQHVRWATLDLLRHHYGPEGHGRNLQSGVFDAFTDIPGPGHDKPDRAQGPARIDLISLHQAVDRLPEEERDAWHLFVYLDLTQLQAAEHLGVSPKTIQRRVRSAKIRLASELDHLAPDAD